MLVTTRLTLALAMLSLISTTGFAASPIANVRGFRAKGDGKANDAEALTKALASGSKNVYLPAGTYVVGPKGIEIPRDVYVHGDGRASILKPVKGSTAALTLREGARIERLLVDGHDVAQGSLSDAVVMLPPGANHVTIESVDFRDCDRTCIVSDHADDLRVSNCAFDRIGIAMLIQFSRRTRIADNRITTARTHGIEFWGNWKWDSKGSSDLIVTGNYVKDGGGGAIWGTGAQRVVIANNIVDGATDVGIDLEWCEDATISANTVRNTENGGISLFFSCKRVSITGNTVINDRPITDPKAAWWSRAGIWLTYPNTESFKGDTGHRDVSIVGNTIFCAEGDRRAMWIGAGSDNVTLSGNTIRGGEIWTGGASEPMRRIQDETCVRLQTADRSPDK